MKTGNPVLNEKVFAEEARVGTSQDSMTLDGTVVKTFGLATLVVAGAGWVWHLLALGQSPTGVIPWLLVGSIGGFILALVTIFNKPISPFTAPIYALLEGFVLGGVSALANGQYPGVVPQAVGLTLGTLFAMLLAYATGLIKVTENFKLGLFAATGGIAIYYFAGFILSFFSIQVPMIWDSGPWGIGFSCFVIVIAALNLVLDFDFIESGVAARAPKYMEWYGAFGLIVTLVWLYMEILRLLSKARSRN
jgi:uncharacterized YccA/Bax inhibitor family protein